MSPYLKFAVVAVVALMEAGVFVLLGSRLRQQSPLAPMLLGASSLATLAVVAYVLFQIMD